MSTVNKNLPDPLPLKKLIGPSFIILGMGLGSGELILWPYLSVNFGLGIIWAAVLGITLQFFINMEIERYTLATGESIFAGLKRKYGIFMPYWFIVTTLIPWIWPGITASAATVLAKSIGIEYSRTIGIILLFGIGIIYGLGNIVYKTQETVQKAIILIGVPFVLLITFVSAKAKDWLSLAQGLVGKGENYWFLPEALPWAIFLSALAFAGAGGNLNLAQSLYVKEKGYGMAANSGNITNVLKSKSASIKIEGDPFVQTTKNIKRFRIWWKRINIEHFIVFWATGAFTMIMLSLLAYSTVYGTSQVNAGISFVIKEAEQISRLANPMFGMFFLVIVGIMLFGTQFSVYGSNARIASENLVLCNKKIFKTRNMSKYFYTFLWIQIISGIIIFLLGFAEPLFLVTISGILNAFAMFTYTGLILYMNKTVLPNSAKPNLFRTVAVSFAFLFYGAFSLFTIYRYLAHYITK
ncbi:MAG: Nramp family divalent metal transporter [Patescibacteria group bacterium]|nr:Nramp family divalent metal transporter [Patescibacteria group bacterium]